MNANAIEIDVAGTPQLTIPTAQDALSQVNRWLHREIGTAIHAAAATFDPATFYWHVSIELAYGATGPLRTIGDVYLHAASGAFAGRPSIEDFRQRAEAVAAEHGIE
jgi:hypothetical protein